MNKPAEIVVVVNKSARGFSAEVFFLHLKEKEGVREVGSIDSMIEQLEAAALKNGPLSHGSTIRIFGQELAIEEWLKIKNFTAMVASFSSKRLNSS